MPGVNLVSRHSKKAKQTNKTPHKAFSVLVEPYNIASPSYTTWRATHSRQHHDRSSGIHLGHLWRLQISCEFLACVIAQQRVQPIVGNPLTEHYQLFVRAYVRADQQVLSLKKKKRKERNLDGSRCYSNASLRGNSTIADPYSQDARTCVKCSRPSAGAGKVRAEQFLCFFSLKCCGLKKEKSLSRLTSAPLNGARRIKCRLSTKVCWRFKLWCAERPLYAQMIS